MRHRVASGLCLLTYISLVKTGLHGYNPSSAYVLYKTEVLLWTVGIHPQKIRLPVARQSQIAWTAGKV